MPNVYLGLGSNKSLHRMSSARIVFAAAKSLATFGSGAFISPLFRSAAWPDPTAPAYVNAVMAMQTAMPPEELLRAVLAIEAGFSRVRENDPALRYAPRTLDIDLLDYEGYRSETSALTLPHPRLSSRDFVLRPLSLLAPEWRHPISGEAIDALCAGLPVGGATLLPFVGAPALQAVSS